MGRKVYAERYYPKFCRRCQVALDSEKTVASYTQWRRGLCRFCYLKYRKLTLKPKRPDRVKDSIPQKVLFEELKKLIALKNLRYNFPIQTLKISDGRRKLNMRYADVADVKRRIVFEYDGERFHNKEKDGVRDLELNRAGWKVVHINKHNIQKVLDGLK